MREEIMWTEDYRRYTAANNAAGATFPGGYLLNLPTHKYHIGNYVGLEIVPFGVGNDNGTFLLDAVLWYPTAKNRDADGNQRGFVGRPLVIGATCTLGTTVGVDGTMVDSTERFADTMAGSLAAWSSSLGQWRGDFGTTNVAYYTPANQNPAALNVQNHKHAEFLTLAFYTFTNVTGANALIRQEAARIR